MTRRDTALNWSTVAFTVGALPSFFFLPHTQPRQCQATTFLNSFCLTESSATIKISSAMILHNCYRQFTLWDWSIWRCFCRISCLCDFWGCSSGLKIIFGRWVDMMLSQRNFCSIKSRFWPVKILGKKLTYPCVIFYLWTWFYFYKDAIYRWGFSCFFKIKSACMTNCHDWQVKFLASEAAILAGHCPLNSCYFKPWFLWLLFNNAYFF